jgi:hypothetical protein
LIPQFDPNSGGDARQVAHERCCESTPTGLRRNLR